ncbi:serine/threonine-protein kinase RIO1 [Belonocnema kinseyi]|uniref:serine/threonine-protein kinase RIO1 n=1 Tax=Belonocnema kinseyi TaxID=2817044 RepID=UPI00143CFC9C|nr:serine/threonine-protein kinase RIO1 [Belonocnema kinseyi]
MSMKALFNFITDPTVTEDNMDEYLDTVSNQMTQESQELNPEQEVDEEVFKQAYIPQRLAEVIDVERDINLAKTGKENLIYKTLVGLKADLSMPAKIPEILATKDRSNKSDEDGVTSSSDEEDSENSDLEDYSEDSEGNKISKFINAARPRNETSENKKARKKAVKEEQAEKRKSKVKKHLKKRKERIAKKK